MGERLTMINAKEMYSLSPTKQEKFIKWLAETVKCYKFSKSDMLDCSMNLMQRHSFEPIIPREFLFSYEDSIEDSMGDGFLYKLNSESAQVINDFGWVEDDYHLTDFIIYFNEFTYVESKRKELKNKYPNSDIEPLLNLHDNLFSWFNIPEINLLDFDKWFTDIVTKHKSNLTNEERNGYKIILAEEEQNNYYMYRGVFYKPYSDLLQANGWLPNDDGTISWY